MPEVTLITTTQVSRLLGVEASTVRRWVISGKLTPCVTTPGGHHRFDLSEVQALIKAPAR